MNPTRHVVIALTLSALILFIAGNRWQPAISKVGPIRPTPKAP